MTLDCKPIIESVVTHALTSGHFERVNQHEPKSAPGTGLTAAVWVDRIRPFRRGSGLSVTSATVVLNIRLYTSMTSEPQDEIDPALAAAVDALMTSYGSDFTLGGQARNIDLFGQSGFNLDAQAGYLTQDGKIYRVVTITLPAIVNDVWTQAE